MHVCLWLVMFRHVPQMYFLVFSRSLSVTALPLLLEATRYADEMLLMAFAVSWSTLWYLIWLFYGSFRQKEPPPLPLLSLTPRLPCSGTDADIFLSSSQTSERQTSFSSPTTLLYYSLCWFTHPLSFFLVIYTFKHEICLIHCEVSQQASDHCDNINMPLCGLVAPWLEFHFRKTILVLFLVSFSSLVFNNPPSRCVHFYSAKIKSSSEKVELLAHRWD